MPSDGVFNVSAGRYHPCCMYILIPAIYVDSVEASEIILQNKKKYPSEDYTNMIKMKKIHKITKMY